MRPTRRVASPRKTDLAKRLKNHKLRIKSKSGVAIAGAYTKKKGSRKT